jgi:hypothetical protein
VGLIVRQPRRIERGSRRVSLGAYGGDPPCKLVQFVVELGSFFIRGGITSASAIPEC